jgi:hypothetical protein
MRWFVPLFCALLLSGCTQKEEQPKVVDVPTKVYFSENFSEGLMGWGVKSSGGGTMEVVDRKDWVGGKALMMRSQFGKSAYAVAPLFPMDWGKDYAVSFDYMLNDRDNFGYTVYQDRNVELDLGEATGIMCGRAGLGGFVGRIDTFGWHRIGVIVRPSEGEYEVFIDGARQKNCNLVKSDTNTFKLGDTDPQDTVHGDGNWANFRITDRM